jgi:hypothetical protein
LMAMVPGVGVVFMLDAIQMRDVERARVLHRRWSGASDRHNDRRWWFRRRRRVLKLRRGWA